MAVTSTIAVHTLANPTQCYKKSVGLDAYLLNLSIVVYDWPVLAERSFFYSRRLYIMLTIPTFV